MKRITLEAVYDSLLHMQTPVEVDEGVRIRAYGAIKAMLDVPAATPQRSFRPHPAGAHVELA